MSINCLILVLELILTQYFASHEYNSYWCVTLRLSTKAFELLSWVTFSGEANCHVVTNLVEEPT